MRVNLSSLYAGPRGSWGPGICELPDDIGTELIEVGVAIPVNMETRTESPAAEPNFLAEEEASVEEELPARRGPRRGQVGKPGN